MGVALWVTLVLVDALVLVAIVAALVGMYRLRHHARTTLIYNRRSMPNTLAEVSGPGSSWSVVDRDRDLVSEPGAAQQWQRVAAPEPARVIPAGVAAGRQ